MDVFWLDGAVTDLDEIVQYIAERDPAAARRVASALLTAVGPLGTHAEIGRRGRIEGTRELVLPRLPFVIVYQVKPTRIEVVRVVHGRRDWQRSGE